MNVLQVILLAIVQGTTEFIPVSSSGHLVLVRELLHWSDEGGIFFDTVLHAGSLLAILIYFRQDWVQTLQTITHRKSGDIYHRHLFIYLIIATIPVVLAGPFIASHMNELRNARTVGMIMIMTASWFFFCEQYGKKFNRNLTWQIAVFMGIAQVFALLPGASRSGLTIGAGVLFGMARSKAARFSFLMAIPTILGATILESGHLCTSPVHMPLWQPVLGFIVCFTVSLAAIHFCLQLFRRYSLIGFGIYLALFGLILVIMR